MKVEAFQDLQSDPREEVPGKDGMTIQRVSSFLLTPRGRSLNRF